MTYRRPSWGMLALTGVAALGASVLLSTSRPVVVRVDGRRLLSDVPPVTTVSNRVFVPLRALGDALGAQIRYDQKKNAVVVVRGDRTLRLKIGNRRATLDRMPMTLAHAPFLVRGRVMFGLRAFERAFGVAVTYDARTARVDVIVPGVVDGGAHSR